MITTVLFGSGVSLVSGIPGIGIITDRILSGEHIRRAADENYYLGGGQRYLNAHVVDTLALLDFVKKDIDSFYDHLKKEHYTNYEDIFYVLRQLRDSYNFEFENPAVYTLISKLNEANTFKTGPLSNVVNEATKYIECLVWQMLSKRTFSFDQFSIVPRLIDQLNLRNIISLNHDLVLETYLSENNISFEDGFALKDHKFPQWQGIPKNTDNLRYLKLHGSIDWFEVRVTQPYQHNEIFKLPRGADIQRIHYEDERFFGVTDGTPKLLIGTFNKMLGYLSDIFEELYDNFKLRLKETNVLIISGYGFADKGINSKLSLWLNEDTAHKMIIIHPYIEDLLKNARSNFHLNIFNGRETHPKVRIINKKFEETALEEISDAVNN